MELSPHKKLESNKTASPHNLQAPLLLSANEIDQGQILIFANKYEQIWTCPAN